jgi:hypothetical protein
MNGMFPLDVSHQSGGPDQVGIVEGATVVGTPMPAGKQVVGMVGSFQACFV